MVPAVPHSTPLCLGGHESHAGAHPPPHTPWQGGKGQKEGGKPSKSQTRSKEIPRESQNPKRKRGRVGPRESRAGDDTRVSKKVEGVGSRVSQGGANVGAEQVALKPALDCWLEQAIKEEPGDFTH